jgi:hypothetical protein
MNYSTITSPPQQVIFIPVRHGFAKSPTDVGLIFRPHYIAAESKVLAHFLFQNYAEEIKLASM